MRTSPSAGVVNASPRGKSVQKPVMPEHLRETIVGRIAFLQAKAAERKAQGLPYKYFRVEAEALIWLLRHGAGIAYEDLHIPPTPVGQRCASEPVSALSGSPSGEPTSPAGAGLRPQQSATVSGADSKVPASHPAGDYSPLPIRLSEDTIRLMTGLYIRGASPEEIAVEMKTSPAMVVAGLHEAGYAVSLAQERDPR